MNLSEPAVSADNITLHPRQLHTEVMNLASGDVWLLQSPTTAEAVSAMKVSPPLIKSGTGTGAMDFAWFLRSPGAEDDGPLEICDIGGHRFARVARVRKFGGFPRG